MLDPEKIAMLEQAQEVVIKTYLPFMRSLYLACIQEGFTTEEAMRLLTAWLHGVAGGKLQ